MGSKFMLLFSAALLGSLGYSAEVMTLTESFDSAAYLDSTNSTGYWNVVDGRAQAAVVTNETASQSVSFGDGSLGTLNVTAGAVNFNTDAYPNGFNYDSVSITGTATITVTGSSPFILRALRTITITRDINVDGQTGAAGGAAFASSASGGAGGAVTPTAGSNGGGVLFGLGGAASAGAGVHASNGTREATGYNGANFFTTDFIAKGGGGGGGGHTAGFAGGRGGASGGMIRISGGGTVNITGNVFARGGGGQIGTDVGTGCCSGNGAGGNGGAIWIQSFKDVTGLAIPLANVNAGTGGGPCGTVACGGAALAQANNGVAGDARVDNDTATGLAAAAGAISLIEDTRFAAPSTTYIVQSRAYDTGYGNAKFEGVTVTQSTPADSSVTVSYSASADGSSFTAWVSDITQLSNQNYRYFRFRIAFTTATAAGTLSPSVDAITVRYSQLPVLGDYPSNANLDLSAGCGVVRGVMKSGGSDSKPALFSLVGLLAWTALALGYRRVLKLKMPE